MGWLEEQLFLALRTRSRNRNAGKILHKIVNGGGFGTAGGHGPMAGARVSVQGRSQRSRADLRRNIVNQVVQAFGEDYRHFHRVLSKKDQALTMEPPPPRDDSKAGAKKDAPAKSDDDAPKKKVKSPSAENKKDKKSTPPKKTAAEVSPGSDVPPAS